ncbi:hypothetical protein [Inquilinus sp.]|jgi:hypothetical protein|uniref:hypothetical protein n=1 Tax=Inquilinus sp. TaxID=1932117 RepID=UPI003783AA21
MRTLMMCLALGGATMAPALAFAQSATDAALAGRIAAINGLLSGIGTLARQTELSEEQVSVQARKSMEGLVSATEAQRLALAKLGAARERATSARTCPEVSAGRAGERNARDAGMAGAGLAQADARRASAGINPLDPPDPADASSGGEMAALVAVGMPLPPVEPRSASVAGEVRRWSDLRRAASVMAARYAVAREWEGQ